MLCNLCHMGGSNKIIAKIRQFLSLELHEFTVCSSFVMCYSMDCEGLNFRRIIFGYIYDNDDQNLFLWWKATTEPVDWHVSCVCFFSTRLIPVWIKPRTENWHSQLSCLTFTIKMCCVKPWPCVVDRWMSEQLHSNTASSFHCLLAKVT